MRQKPNLFINTRHLTDRKEDHLTEFFVALLMSSPSFRKGYEKLVLSRFFRKQGWEGVRIVDVETQCHYEDAKRIPDVILHLSNGKKIACEHKIEALETGKDEEKNPNQLWDYLHLPDISGLVYIRSNWKPPVKDVITHPNYIKSLKYEHFLWRDFFPLLRKDKTALGKWMKEAFEQLGYTPPLPAIGDMSRPNDPECKRNRENYKKFLDDTYHLARELGWKAESAWDEGMWCGKNPKANSSQVMFTASQPERFLVRVTPKPGQDAHVRAKLKTTITAMKDIRVEMLDDTASRVENKKAPVILLTTTLRDILGKAKGENEIRGRLSSFYGTILMALQDESLA